MIVGKNHANVKEVINPLQLYLLVDVAEGAGKELSMAEMVVRENRPLRRGKALLLVSLVTKCQQAAWRDFMPLPSSSQRPLDPPPWGPQHLPGCHTDSPCLACPRLNISTFDFLFFQYLLSQLLVSNTLMFEQTWPLTHSTSPAPTLLQVCPNP